MEVQPSEQVLISSSPAKYLNRMRVRQWARGQSCGSQQTNNGRCSD